VETRPPQLTDEQLRTSLSDGWGIDAVELVYAPVGFGSHHWYAAGSDGDRWFLTVDDLDAKQILGSTRDSAREGLRTSFDTARALGDGCGLRFVVAPRSTLDGSSLRDLGDRHTLAVFPHVAGSPGSFGQRRDADSRRGVLDLLAAVHRSAPVVLPRVAQPIPGQASLDAALDDLSTRWSGGPRSEPAREWLRAHERGLRAAVDAVRSASLDDTDRLVVTHGEPHPGNVMDTAGGPVLVDWDTVGLSPPERDLWLVLTDDADIAYYESSSGIAVDRSALTRYAQVWDLADAASYVAQFRRPHTFDADTEHAWSYLSALDF
jgi:spectinomycin phosphotransferase